MIKIHLHLVAIIVRMLLKEGKVKIPVGIVGPKEVRWGAYLLVEEQ